jgi:plasmid stability protein
MVKTTVYLPDDLKHSLERLAAATGRSEAELVREAVSTLVHASERPRPRGALFSSDDPMLFGANVDDALKGFGER